AEPVPPIRRGEGRQEAAVPRGAPRTSHSLPVPPSDAAATNELPAVLVEVHGKVGRRSAERAPGPAPISKVDPAIGYFKRSPREGPQRQLQHVVQHGWAGGRRRLGGGALGGLRVPDPNQRR